MGTDLSNKEYTKCVKLINDFFLTHSFRELEKMKELIQINRKTENEELYKYFNELYGDMKYGDLKRGIQAVFKVIDILAVSKDMSSYFEIKTISYNNFNVSELRCVNIGDKIEEDSDLQLIQLLATTTENVQSVEFDGNIINTTMYRKDMKQYVKTYFLINGIIVDEIILHRSKTDTIPMSVYTTSTGFIWKDTKILQRSLPEPFTDYEKFDILYYDKHSLKEAQDLSEHIDKWFGKKVTSLELNPDTIIRYREKYPEYKKINLLVFKETGQLAIGSGEEVRKMFSEDAKSIIIPSSRLKSTIYDFMHRYDDDKEGGRFEYKILSGLIYLYNKHRNIACIPFSNPENINKYNPEQMEKLKKDKTFKYYSLTDVYSILYNEMDKKELVKMSPILISEVRSCLKTGKRFIPILIYIIKKDDKDEHRFHQSAMLYDSKANTIEFFDPNGISKKEYTVKLIKAVTKKVSEVFEKSLETKFAEIYEPIDYCPLFSYQLLQSKEKIYENVSGTCCIWTFWYLDLRMSNPNVSREDISSYAMASILKNYKTYTDFILGYSSALSIYGDTVIEEEGNLEINKKIRTRLFENLNILLK